MLRIIMRIVAVFLILSFFIPFPGGSLRAAMGLSILVCVSLRFALFVQGWRRRSSLFNKMVLWIENKMGERWARGIMFTRPDADPREHFKS